SSMLHEVAHDQRFSLLSKWLGEADFVTVSEIQGEYDELPLFSSAYKKEVLKFYTLAHSEIYQSSVLSSDEKQSAWCGILYPELLRLTTTATSIRDRHFPVRRFVDEARASLGCFVKWKQSGTTLGMHPFSVLLSRVPLATTGLG